VNTEQPLVAPADRETRDVLDVAAVGARERDRALDLRKRVRCVPQLEGREGGELRRRGDDYGSENCGSAGSTTS
jgi:hypothetical protein